jgi:hypothetical protein
MVPAPGAYPQVALAGAGPDTTNAKTTLTAQPPLPAVPGMAAPRINVHLPGRARWSGLPRQPLSAGSGGLSVNVMGGDGLPGRPGMPGGELTGFVRAAQGAGRG